MTKNLERRGGGLGVPTLLITVTHTLIDADTVDIQTDWRSMISLMICNKTYEVSGILDQDGVRGTDMENQKKPKNRRIY